MKSRRSKVDLIEMVRSADTGLPRNGDGRDSSGPHSSTIAPLDRRGLLRRSTVSAAVNRRTVPLMVASSSAEPSLKTLSVASVTCDEIGHAALVAGRRVDEIARRLRQRDLRRRDLVGHAGRRREARIHLEVDVRPAARVAAGKDRRERDLAVGVGLLHAAQVVLVRDARRCRASSGPADRSATGRRRGPPAARTSTRTRS